VVADFMIVTLTFHSAFRVGTGDADGTAHATVDRDDPVPASSLKGLMRASAERLLPYRPEVVAAVFGTPRRPCPWHWSPARFDRPPETYGPETYRQETYGRETYGRETYGQEWEADQGRDPQAQDPGPAPDVTPPVTRRARVGLDPATGTALGDHLVIAEEMSAATARFTVTRVGPLPLAPDGRPWLGLTEEDHLAVLACAAAGMHELGAGRRRGLGWVSCETAGPRLDDALLARFDRLATLPDDAPADGAPVDGAPVSAALVDDAPSNGRDTTGRASGSAPDTTPAEGAR
jgi:CRISPR/Cas system CSM-associated protein Csm3 (group 7 of RAMP superfamily)